MEADLLRFYRVDLRDLFCRDGSGRRVLTMRRVWVLVSHLPPESATMSVLGSDGWTRTEVFLTDVYAALAGQPHPARKTAKRRVDGVDEKIAAALARKRQREADIAAGLIE